MVARLFGRIFCSSRFQSSLRKVAARSSSTETRRLRSWTPPRTIPCIADEIRSQPGGCAFGEGVCSCDKHHWLAICKTNGLEFSTQHALFNHYISTLASVIGSKNEAMNKIYLVSVGWRFGFGVEIDAETKYKLEANPDIVAVVEDCRYQARNKDPQGSLDRFIPFNSNNRFNDIFSYHHFSECKSKEKPNHWLIHVKKPDGGFDSEQHTIDFCAKILATVLGSEKEAKKRIYILWCKAPFGFGAEIDEETAHKLRGPQVLTVLPDYAFDVKQEDYGVLIISHLSRQNSRSRFIVRSLTKMAVDDEETEDSEDEEDVEDANDSDDYEIAEDAKDSKYSVEGMEDSEAEDVKDANDSDSYEIAEDAKNSKCSVEAMEDSEDEEHVKDANDSEESDTIKFNSVSDNYEIAEDSKYSVGNEYSGSAKDIKDTDKGEDFDDVNDAGNAKDYKDEDSQYNFSIPPDPREAEEPSCEPCYRHWFITVEKPFGDFVSMQQMIDHYIKMLARAVGSEKEAKGKIYRVVCEDNLYGFGAEIDEETSNKLKDVSGVRAVIPEFFFSKDHRGGDLISSQSFESFEAFVRGFKVDLKEWKISA